MSETAKAHSAVEPDGVTRLKHLLAELDTIYRSAPIGLCVIDTACRFVRINDKMAEINGLSAAEHVGRSIREVVPQLADQAEALVASIIRTGEPVLDVEVRGATLAEPDKLRVWREHWYPLKDNAGKVTGINVVAQEITECKRAQSSLRISRDKLEHIVCERTEQLESTIKALENEMEERKHIENQLQQWSRVFMDAADPIIIEDMNARILDINREAEHVYGWRRGELIGQSVQRLIPQSQYHQAEEIRRYCRKGGEIRNREGLRLTRAGKSISVLLTMFPIVDDAGNIGALASIAKDITYRQKAEAELRESRRRMQELSRKSIEALESDRRTTAKELHDSVGASLAAIKFKLEGLCQKLLADPKHAVNELTLSIGHLSAAIKETKRISANLRPMTLDDLGLLLTIEWYARQFSENVSKIRLIRNIEVAEDEIPDPLKIVIYRVLQEALSNVAKHSQADCARIHLCKDEDKICLVVEDNGSGFDIQQTLNREDPLSGYGLRGMQERAEISGGVFELQSKPGEGTRLSLKLPLQPRFHGG